MAQSVTVTDSLPIRLNILNWMPDLYMPIIFVHNWSLAIDLSPE
jgi:hypothetical protein